MAFLVPAVPPKALEILGPAIVFSAYGLYKQSCSPLGPLIFLSVSICPIFFSRKTKQISMAPLSLI